MKSLEVRGFGDLRKLFDERSWPFPIKVDIDKTITVKELASKLEIPLNKIEVTMINGSAEGLSHPVNPGDRVAFVPPGTPGPYRVMLGFIQKKNA